MDAQTFLGGAIIGFSIAAPVGPIGVLCVRRTLEEGRLHGLVSGLGAATADAIYGSIAAFGLASISKLLVQQQHWFSVLGGAFLCFLGIRAILAKPSEKSLNKKKFGLKGAYVSTFLLTLSNPVTILSFIAVFASLGIGSSGDFSSASLLVLSVFLGSASWWLVLSGAVNTFRAKVTPRILTWINRVSGVILLGFGLVALASIILH